MKIALLADTHWGVRSDSPIFLEHCVNFHENVFFPYLEKNNISTIIHLGDLMDKRKYSNFLTLKTMKECFFDKIKNNQYDLHLLLGNHCTYYTSTNDVNSPNLLLKEYDIKIYEEPIDVKFDDVPIFFLPWVPKGSYEKALDLISKSSSPICIGHLDIIGFEMHSGLVNKEHGFSSDTFGNFQYVFSGHYHHRSDNGHIFYLGSPYQMTWNDYGDLRGFHVFDTETRQLLFVGSNNEIFKKIYYNDENKTSEEVFSTLNELDLKNLYVKVVVEKITSPYTYENFLEEIYKQSPADLSIVENFESNVTTNTIDETKDTLTILSDYVNGSNLEQKDEINSLLRTLYNEALVEIDK